MEELSEQVGVPLREVISPFETRTSMLILSLFGETSMWEVPDYPVKFLAFWVNLLRDFYAIQLSGIYVTKEPSSILLQVFECLPYSRLVHLIQCLNAII